MHTGPEDFARHGQQGYASPVVAVASVTLLLAIWQWFLFSISGTDSSRQQLFIRSVSEATVLCPPCFKSSADIWSSPAALLFFNVRIAFAVYVTHVHAQFCEWIKVKRYCRFSSGWFNTLILLPTVPSVLLSSESFLTCLLLEYLNCFAFQSTHLQCGRGFWNLSAELLLGPLCLSESAMLSCQLCWSSALYLSVVSSFSRGLGLLNLASASTLASRLWLRPQAFGLD